VECTEVKPDRGPGEASDERSARVPEPKLNTISSRAARATWALPEAPDPAELNGVFRMRRLIEPELSAKACLLHTDAQFDELQADMGRFLDTTADADEIYRAHRAFHTRLIAPAATAWDLRVLTPLWQETDRSVRAWMNRLGIHPMVLLGQPACRTLLASFRTRDPQLARAACLRELDDNADRLRQFFAQAN
jgi:DNA-binding GntR family transcriptional regulator